jgi:hypothetical protein
MTFKMIRTAFLTALAAATIAACAVSTATRAANARSVGSGVSLASPTPAEGRPHAAARSTLAVDARNLQGGQNP